MPLVVLLLFVPLFLLISFALAQGGWSRLAGRHRATSELQGPTWRFRSATIGRVRYGSSLTFTVTDAGLGMRVLPIHRFMHPPLLIPWADLQVRRERVFYFWRVELSTREVPGVVVVIGQDLALAMARAAGPAWPDPEMVEAPAAANERPVDSRPTLLLYLAIWAGVAAIMYFLLGSANDPSIRIVIASMFSAAVCLKLWTTGLRIRRPEGRTTSSGHAPIE